MHVAFKRRTPFLFPSSLPAGDGTSTNPDIYSFALIKTKNALFDFSGEKLSIFF
jgi:hypothetical protein